MFVSVGEFVWITSVACGCLLRRFFDVYLFIRVFVCCSCLVIFVLRVDLLLPGGFGLWLLVSLLYLAGCFGGGFLFEFCCCVFDLTVVCMV